MIRATPQTAIVEEVADMAEARLLLLSDKVVGVVEIADGFAKRLLSGESAAVVYYDSGTNISTSSLSAKAVQTVLLSALPFTAIFLLAGLISPRRSISAAW